MSLYRKFRPNKLTDIHGNGSTCQALQDIIDRDDRPKAFLFAGPSGCGKTTLARILRRKLKCKKDDYTDLNSADFTGVDTIRQVIRSIAIKPFGESRVFLLDECHMLSGSAQNALLKTLEDTPRYAYIILATTRPEKLIKEVRNRCTTFYVNKLNDNEMEDLLTGIAASVNTKLPKDVLNRLVDIADGSPRAGLVFLDKIHRLKRKDMLSELKDVVMEGDEQIIELCRALIKHKPWGTISKILNGLRQHEPESVRRVVLSYFSKVLIGDGGGFPAHVLECFLDPFYDSGFAGLVLSCHQVMNDVEPF